MFAVDGLHLPRHKLSPSNLEDDQLIRAARESKFIIGFNQLFAGHNPRQLASHVHPVDRKPVMRHEKEPPRLVDMESMRSASEPVKDPLHCAITLIECVLRSRRRFWWDRRGSEITHAGWRADRFRNLPIHTLRSPFICLARTVTL